jgi:uncharacterized protein (TIGR02996 family)
VSSSRAIDSPIAGLSEFLKALGTRFDGSLSCYIEAVPTLVVRRGDTTIWRGTIPTWGVTIGSSPRSDVYLPGDLVSPEHARLDWSNDALQLTDCESATGIYRNGETFERGVIDEKDRITIGLYTLRFGVELEADEISPSTERNVPEPITDRSSHRSSSAPATHRYPSNPDDLAPPTTRVSLPLAPVEIDFLTALRERPHDDETRLVYADWLSEEGQPLKAEFLRLDCRLARLARSEGQSAEPSPERRELEERVRAIAPASDASWRALVSHPMVDACVRVELEFACPREWNALAPTDDDKVRHCGACDRRVYFCGSLAEVFARASTNECVAFDIALSPTKARMAYKTASGVGIVMGEVASPDDFDQYDSS